MNIIANWVTGKNGSENKGAYTKGIDCELVDLGMGIGHLRVKPKKHWLAKLFSGKKKDVQEKRSLPSPIPPLLVPPPMYPKTDVSSTLSDEPRFFPFFGSGLIRSSKK